MRFLVPVFAFLLALAGCHGRADAPGEAPTGVTATAGDGLVLLSWDVLPDLTYWIFFQPGSSVTAAGQGSIAIRRVFNPRAVGPLSNGTQYAFVMNATRQDSSAGPSSPIVVATPRLAGATWISGTPLGTAQDLKGIAISGARLVVVGNADTANNTATIFAGDFNYANPSPPGVTAWTPASFVPPGFAVDLSAVTFSTGFVALGTNGSILSSADGLTWGANGSIPSGGMNGIAFGFISGVTPTYVAVGDGGAIFTSSDLVTWTPRTSGTSSALTSVAVLNGNFVVTGEGGTLLISPDASTWTPQTSNAGGNTLRATAFSAVSPVVHYVAVGDAGTIVTSADGTTWAAVTPAPLSENLRSVTVGGASGSRFLAVGQSGAVAFSDDGLSWSTVSAGPPSLNLAKVLVAPSMYVAVGDGGANAVSR